MDQGDIYSGCDFAFSARARGARCGPMGAGASAPRAVKAGFDAADKNRDGKLDAPELKAALEGAGATGWSNKRVGHLLGVMDVNGD